MQKIFGAIYVSVHVEREQMVPLRSADLAAVLG